MKIQLGRLYAVALTILNFHLVPLASAFLVQPHQHGQVVAKVATTSSFPIAFPAQKLWRLASTKEDRLLEQTLLREHVKPDALEPPSPGSMVLSTSQSAQTVVYRAALLGATITYSFQLLLPVLQVAGLSLTGETNGASILSMATVFFVALAAAIAPKAGSKSNNKSAFLVDGKVLAASVATLIAGQPLVGLAALFVREIYYFGLAYKVEAALGLVASLGVLFLAPQQEQLLVTAEAATSLALAVMVFGKFLEPLEEDWMPNESEFLSNKEL